MRPPAAIFVFALLASPPLIAAADAPNAPPAKADREKQELRYVELLRTGLRKPPADEDAKFKMMEEMRSLLLTLAGIDPKNPPPDAGQRLAATQADVLARRDPALRDEMLVQTKSYTCRSKQIEAKVEAKGLFREEMAYQQERDRFAPDMKTLRAEGVVSARRYDWAIVRADERHFLARATGKGEMAGDVWEIDEKGEPKNTADLCGKGQPAVR
jgi:hypothetical protein